MSQVTKRALAASLIKLLSQKPLDKVTVKDIIEDCGVNRQTFYYHFKDIYDLVDWIFLEMASEFLEGKETYDTWQQGFTQILYGVLEPQAHYERIQFPQSRAGRAVFIRSDIRPLARCSRGGGG